MRTTKVKLLNALLGTLTVGALAFGCSTSDDDGAKNEMTNTGGQAGTGGSPGSGGSGMVTVECPGTNVEPCGGDLTGKWNVAASCMELSGDMDVSITSLGCPTVPVVGMLEVSGSLSVLSDGSYVDSTTTTGSVEFPLDPSCLTVSSVDVECADLRTVFEALGWATATCSDSTGQCSCTLTADHAGGLGAVHPYYEEEGVLTTSDNTFTMGPGTYSYCAQGDKLEITPQMSALSGRFVMLKDGVSAATGGSTGSGGQPGAGGSSPTGGATGSGGAMGSGGTMSSGGASNSGGASASGGADASGGSDGAGGAPPVVADKPCDIYDSAGTPCVAAHSTVRALFKDYDGALYQVKRADGQYQDIPLLSPGGYADSSVQDAFCDGSTCVMWRLYDQSGHDNFLEAQTPDSTVGGNTGMTAASATNEQVMVGGHPVYSLFTRPNQAYWNDGSQNGMPVGAEPQGIYMVTSGEHYNGACCYNYGNGQLNRLYSGGPMMDSIYFGDSTQWGNGSGPGPWVMADMEDGMLAGGMGDNDANTSLPFTFVTAMEKNDGTTTFALKGGDATASMLKTMWDGPLPNSKRPMEKQGGVILGAGGDCCLHNNNLSEGTFYEGAIVAGYPSNETDEAIHANIVEAGYGK